MELALDVDCMAGLFNGWGVGDAGFFDAGSKRFELVRSAADPIASRHLYAGIFHVLEYYYGFKCADHLAIHVSVRGKSLSLAQPKAP